MTNEQFMILLCAKANVATAINEINNRQVSPSDVVIRLQEAVTALEELQRQYHERDGCISLGSFS